MALAVCALLGSTLLLQVNVSSGQNLLQPTATPQNAELIKALQTLIEEDECIVPCWWGWQLGEDNLEEAQTLAIEVFGEPLMQTNARDETYTRLSRAFFEARDPEIFNDFPPSLALYFDTEESLTGVRFIVGSPKHAYVDLSPYMPPHILSLYGEPDEITIDYPGESGGLANRSYDIVFRYETRGVAFIYRLYFDTAPSSENERIPICNSLDYTQRITIVAEVEGAEIIPPRSVIERDIDQVSNLDIAEFTQAFVQEDVCLETIPIERWSPISH
jgi:hypothetical protein